MPAKVILKISKGSLSGGEFSYDQKESVILGRSKDCNIVLPESTISRCHCFLDIVPPAVMVRDFGSRNGTFLNGKKIGERERHLSAEEGRNQKYEEFSMKSGDKLGLGGDCEITLDIVLPQYCAECFCEIEGQVHNNDFDMPVCNDCHTKMVEQKKKEKAERIAALKAEEERREAEKRARELAAREKAAKEARDREEAARKRREEEQRIAALEEQRKQEALRKQKEEAERKAAEAKKAAERDNRMNPKCQSCGTSLRDEEAVFCSQCRKDPVKLLKYMMEQAMKKNQEVAAIAGYRNIKSLGQGGMGAVWLVEEEKTGKQMALKLMLPQAAANERSKEMFLREAFVAGQLNHKNVVRQFNCGRSGDTYFILMEFCRGGSVDKLMERNGGKLNIDLATHITLQILEGLDYTHNTKVVVTLKDGKNYETSGVVHRDFKPGNIFLSDDSSRPTAKVADFGLAKAFETAGLSGFSRTGDLAGTPVFMPRQQIINYRYSKPAVDVWAAAASYYLMLTGALPKNYQGNDVIAAGLNSAAIPIRNRNSSIPRKLAEVIDTALIEKPEIGFQSAGEFKRMIERAL